MTPLLLLPAVLSVLVACDSAPPPAAEAPPPPPKVVLERPPEGKAPLKIEDPLAWLDSEVRSPDPAVVALGERVEGGQDLPAALAELDAWLAAHPDDVDARYWRGRARLAAGDAEAGRADLQAAVDADPAFLAARQHLTDALVGAADFPAALVQLDALIAARPEVAMLYANRAYVRRSLGDGPGSAHDVIKACDLGNARACIGAAREKARLEAQAEPPSPLEPSPAAETPASPAAPETP